MNESSFSLLIPSILSVLSFDFFPFIIDTFDFGTPNDLEKNSNKLEFAFPSTGGDVIFTFSLPSW